MPSESPQQTPAPQAWSLAKKIYAAAAALLLLFLAMALANYLGFGRVEKQFAEFAESSRIESRLLEIDLIVTQLERKVAAFTITRNSMAAESIRLQGSALLRLIDESLKTEHSEEVASHLEIMQKHLTNYLDNFETVIEERELRSQLVEEKLIGATDRLNRFLTVMIDNTFESDTDLRNSLYKTRMSLFVASSSALQFLSNPDAEKVRVSLAELEKASREVAARLEETENDLTSSYQVIQKGVQAFQRDFLRIVQATRAYLYLVNVVMAGDAAEFSYQAKRLREMSQRQLSRIQKEALAETQRANRFTLTLTGLASLLGLVIAWAIATHILRPILTITDTFVRLLKGEMVEQIPNLDRSDELGDLARAADRLKVQSEETQRLLVESQRLATELETQAAALAKSNEDLDSFAYVASHDLKSPLRAIDNVSKWIAEDAGEVLPEKSKEHLDVLRQRVGRMESLLDDLLAYSRAGRMNELAGSVEVHRLVDEIPSLIDWPSDATLEIEGTLPTVTAEETVFQRIFLNLITNAVKYRSQEPLQIRVKSKELEETYEFSVADNGMGIAGEFHESIFKMFRRLHRQSDIEGTGMGLSLVQKLVGAGGGRVWVESAEGEGATFRFTWPK